MQSPESLALTASIGNTSLTLNSAAPQDWQIGSTIGIDSYNANNAEVVTITSVNNAIIGISALTKNHISGAPVINVNIVNDFISPASRWFDNVTNNDAGYAYETWLDSKEAYIDNKGYIVAPLDKPLVAIGDVISATFQCTPMDPIDTLNIAYARIKADHFLQVVAQNSYSENSGVITVNYKGGFSPIPDDIVQAVTVMACRFYKERDSGYSDVIGSSDTGILEYKKAMPADVKIVVDNYRRCVE